MSSTGIFVVIEGLDGSGTTTQTGLLVKWFAEETSRFGPCIATFEPTPGPAGSIARMALNHRLSLDSTTMALLFAADRADHVWKTGEREEEPGIALLLKQGIHVVSDRFLLSSLAYQSLDLPMEWILSINQQIIPPDITIFIDIDPDVSMDRLRKSRLHHDLYEADETQSRVRTQYETAIRLLEGKGQTIVRVDGNRTEDQVHQDIKSEVWKRLDSK